MKFVRGQPVPQHHHDAPLKLAQSCATGAGTSTLPVQPATSRTISDSTSTPSN